VGVRGVDKEFLGGNDLVTGWRRGLVLLKC
jgi:hypothetical protein